MCGFVAGYLWFGDWSQRDLRGIEPIMFHQLLKINNCSKM